jgi:glycosyltransferase involved in cell wall biosynthesis
MYAVLAKWWLGGKVRVVHTQHSFFDLEKYSRYKFYHRAFVRFADELVVVSDDTRKTYMKLGVSKNRITVIPNGVPFSEKPILKRADKIAARDQLLAELQANPAFGNISETRDDFWILYLARVHPVKGQSQALVLWSKLPEALRKKARLFIIGPGSEKNELERIRGLASKVPSSDRVIVPGGTTKASAWINASDLLLSCSEFEGLPLTPLEALGQGTPLLLSKIAGHEFLSHVAPLYNLQDPDDGAKKLEEILTNLEQQNPAWIEKLSEASKWVRDHYSLKQMTRAYIDMYNKALK